MDSVTSGQSAWQSLYGALKEAGQTVIEAGGDRIAAEIRGSDSVGTAETPAVQAQGYGEAPIVQGRPVPTEGAFMGTLRSIDPKNAAIAVAALIGLLVVVRRFS